MAEIDTIPAPPDESPGGSSITLFLGLYLLVLAFFILMVSISTLEDVKSTAVMDSLSSTFSTILPPSADITVFASREGSVVSGEDLQAEVTTQFKSALQIAKVEVTQPGRLMRVTIAADGLFHADEDRIREAKLPFLDRIVAALSVPPPGMHHDMEFVVASPLEAGTGLPITQSLEMRRAGSFARAILGRGAPANSIAIGLAPGDPKTIVIWFRTRFEDEARQRFQEDIVGEP
jgi:hypothetical protein